MKNVGPINGNEQSKSGNDYINELFQTDDETDEEDGEEEARSDLENKSGLRQETLGLENKISNISKEGSQFKQESRNIILNLNKNALRNIVMLICDEAGFLLEQKLVNLIEPLEKNEKSMVKLDSIFKALGIETESDVKLLAQYFINHRNYQDLANNKDFVERTKSELENESSNQNGNGTNRSKSDDKMVIPNDQIELIDPNEVITALKTFLKFHHKHDK